VTKLRLSTQSPCPHCDRYGYGYGRATWHFCPDRDGLYEAIAGIPEHIAPDKNTYRQENEVTHG
jgi:hypothetical protein